MIDSAVAIVLAAGMGERLSGAYAEAGPKAFVELGGKPLLAWATEAAAGCSRVSSLVIAAPPGLEELAAAAAATGKPVSVITGGDTRQASVRAALAAVPDDVAFVVCHDAARPFATASLFGSVLEALDGPEGADGAVPVLPIPDTVKRVHDALVVGTEERQGLALAQTPQGFRGAALRDAHARAANAGLAFTDDAAVLEWAGYRVKAVAGEVGNFKITTADDLERAESVAREMAHG